MHQRHAYKKNISECHSIVLLMIQLGDMLFTSLSAFQVKSGIIDRARKDGITETNENLFKYFIDCVRANLHVILCMSPVGDPFRFVQNN